jgi:dienelactone hydrolase
MARPRQIRHSFELEGGGGEHVPAILQLPAGDGRVPGVLLLHGFSSRKERMADSIGRALLRRGIASLAIDLPLHGAREAGIEGLSLRNPVALVQKWRLAVREANSAIEYLAGQPAIDPRHLAIAGYSLGAYLAVLVASGNKRVRAVALAAGGDLPADTPFASLVRTIADPRRAVRALDGRPLLMVNGRSDRTIRPEQARALFDAAGEPKELRWYDGGHWPPADAIEVVAEWLSALGEDLEPGRPASAPARHGRKQPLD